MGVYCIDHRLDLSIAGYNEPIAPYIVDQCVDQHSAYQQQRLKCRL